MKEYLINEYQAIWNCYLDNNDFNFKTVLERDLLFQYDDVQNPDIVFVGINPSYSGVVDARKTYDRSSLIHSYFKPFKDITEEVNKMLNRAVTWTHLDLLVFRETSQDFITKQLIKNSAGRLFIKEQLSVSKKLLEYYNPKIVVVSNALARALFKKEKGISELEDFGYTFRFSDEIGTDIISGGVLDGTPVFFTSMLSGQRALDVGSRKRLEWHIAKILNDL